MPGVTQPKPVVRSFVLTARSCRFVACGTFQVLILLSLWSPRATAAPEETYEIKLYKPRTGDKILVVKDKDDTKTTLAMDPDGKVFINKKKKSGESFKYSDEILEQHGDKPSTCLRRIYEKAQLTTDGTTTTLPLQGKTVLIEKKGLKYRFSYEGGKELTADESAVLSKEFDEREDKFDPNAIGIPSKAVALGETWMIDLAGFIKNTGMDKGRLDITKGTGTGKLVRVYRKDGKSFGVIEVKIEVPLLSVGEGAEQVVFKEGARFSFSITFDMCIDGTSNAGSVAVSFSFKGSAVVKSFDGKDLTGDLDVRSKFDMRQENLRR